MLVNVTRLLMQKIHTNCQTCFPEKKKKKKKKSERFSAAIFGWHFRVKDYSQKKKKKKKYKNKIKMVLVQLWLAL